MEFWYIFFGIFILLGLFFAPETAFNGEPIEKRFTETGIQISDNEKQRDIEQTKFSNN